MAPLRWARISKRSAGFLRTIRNAETLRICLNSPSHRGAPPEFDRLNPIKVPAFAGQTARGDGARGSVDEVSKCNVFRRGACRDVVWRRYGWRGRRRVLQLQRNPEVDEQLSQQARPDAGGAGDPSAQRLR